ncbi:hypothetical protein IV39_GL000538 [Lactiplantibacillus plantarum]|jgi:bifunctional N-acetylglucosamine-1-phosphate-uridyltransferase/glucosamine-1-phosphate-acetyltransferase GlmU-like protein|nr:hypothetical protein IV39_GL000538 [Lactiplantibacillus plantarum]
MLVMPQRKQTTVARILSQYEIIIAVGEVDGIKVGDQFTIVGKSNDEITNPKTGEVIGFVPIKKAVVRAKQVFERFTICENANTKYSSLFGAASIAANFDAKSPLNVRKEDIQSVDKNAKPVPIEVGDEVEYIH